MNVVSMLVHEYKNTFAAGVCTFIYMYRFLPLCLFM